MQNPEIVDDHLKMVSFADTIQCVAFRDKDRKLLLTRPPWSTRPRAEYEREKRFIKCIECHATTMSITEESHRSFYKCAKCEVSMTCEECLRCQAFLLNDEWMIEMCYKCAF